MSSYDAVKLNISPDQHEKLKDAAENGKSVSMRVNIGKKAGRHTFLLTHSQRNRLDRAKLMKKANVTIKLSRKEIQANAEHRGGFIGTLLGLASKVLPKLLVDKAYEMLTSGEKLTASELKVCLDTCKTYGVEVDEQPKNSITDDLPFDEK